MKENEIKEYFLNAIDIIVENRFKEMSKSNYYIEAEIKEYELNGMFTIDYNGYLYKGIKKRQELDLLVGDIVLVCVVNGDFSNKFIDLKRP